VDHLPEILKIIAAGLERDPRKVQRYAELLAGKAAAAGDSGAAAALLRSISPVKAASLKPVGVPSKVGVPVDSESRVSLADITHPALPDAPLILEDDAFGAINDFISAYQRSGELIAAGLTGPGHVLLYGPPGCGKTQVAKYIAAKLELPLVTARLDGVVSSFLGSTSKNLRALFDFVDDTPCVFFLDEFDAVAKMRDDPHELGELKRVVNSLLQNMDLLPYGIAVIAATNHPHLLDPAVWRRFEFHVKIFTPGRTARRALFGLYMPSVSGDARALDALSALADGMTAADIKTACEVVRREAVLNGTSGQPGVAESVQALLKFRLRSSPNGREHGDGGGSIDQQIAMLRTADPKVFTYEVIAATLGVSKGKVHNVLTKEDHHAG
jgi:hypothetical protein